MRRLDAAQRLAVAGFAISWLLFAVWCVLNTFVHPPLRVGTVLQAITVSFCPAIMALMAAGDHLELQLTIMVVVSAVNAGLYWMLGKWWMWARGTSSGRR
jgi:hypothetical protein